MTIQQPAVDLTQPGPDEKRRFPVFSKHHTTVATVLALCAWTVAVFDFGLFGTLLPAMQQEFGWTATEAYAINTWIAVGTAIVCFGIGPVIDRLGRRKGMMTTIGGTAIVSGLTALIPTGIPFLSNGLLVLVRSFGGLGFSEQAVNATYMNEVYQVTEVADKRKRPGFHYSFIQGGWPLGFLLASALALVFLPSLGWRALYLMATVPAAIIVWLIAKKLKETPQFELHHKLTQLEKSGKTEEAHALAHAFGVEHSSAAPLKRIWEPHLRRNTIVLSLAWIFNFFGILIFSILGSSVLKNAKGVELSDAFWMLIVINGLAYFGYVFHGWLGDKIGRKRTIIGGWILSGISFAIMLSPLATRPLHDHRHLRRRTVLPGRTVRRDPVLHGGVLPRQLPCHRHSLYRRNEPARHHSRWFPVHASGRQRRNRCCSLVGRRGRNAVLRPADDRREAAGRSPARGPPP